jgi:D-isomer specific 2-hydroxyacid dehydrogenase, NAD binding domain.
MAKWKVVATTVTFGKINKEPLERLLAGDCEVITNPFGRPFTKEELITYCRDADAIIAGNDKLPGEVIEKCPKLKIIAKHGVGVDGIDLEAAKRLGVTVTNAPGTNAEEVADLAIAFILLLARGIIEGNENVKQGKWKKPGTGISMYEKTIGILGLGAIGCATARRARGFGMNVQGYDVRQNPEAVRMGVKFVPLDELLRNSDFISLHLPLTSETRHLLNRERISMLKKGVLIANTARSQLIDYEALREGLRNGSIGGYATDVYDMEPPAHHPIFDLPNVITTPHIGGGTKDSNRRMGNVAVDNVLAVLRGEKAPNIIV